MDNELETVLAIVEKLQAWIEDHDGLSTCPLAGFTWTEWDNGSLQVFIGELIVWIREYDEELTFEYCRDRFLAHILESAPFWAEAKALQVQQYPEG